MPSQPSSQFTTGRTEDGHTRLEVRLDNKTVDTRNISEHLKNIFQNNELWDDAVIRKFRITAADGKKYLTQFYNLEAIITLGYRVNSKHAIQFRQWVPQVLRRFAIKGFVLDNKRLENGVFLNKDYFERLLSETREIRLSEYRFYQEITDIYATNLDYNKNDKTTQDFFARVQNKLHFANHAPTAAELIMRRSGSEKEHMRLTSWDKAPDGKIAKSACRMHLNIGDVSSMPILTWPKIVLNAISP